MKIYTLAILMLVLFASTTFAGTGALSTNLVDFDLSKNVTGAYYPESGLANYIISTSNSQGNMSYGSGSFVSQVYETDGTVVVGSYSSATFASGTVWDAK